MSVREIQYREALNEALREEMQRDLLVFCFGEGIAERGGSFQVTKGLLGEFGPQRVLDTPISEIAISGGCVGAAIVGTRPVGEILFIDFMTLTMDMVSNQAAKYNFMTGGNGKVPMVLRTQGGCGNGLAAQHSQSLEAWFFHIPGLKVVMPSTPYDAKGLLKSAIRDDEPVIFIEHKKLYFHKGEVPEEEYLIPIGKGDIKREGKDVTIFAYSLMATVALEAAEKLAKEGIDIFAPAIGTAHGIYKGEPKIAFDLLGEIAKRIKIPIAIHGGTGLSEEVFRRCISLGGVKVNISTQIKHVYRDSYIKYFTDSPNDYEPIGVIKYVHKQIIETVKGFIKIFGSDGKS